MIKITTKLNTPKSLHKIVVNKLLGVSFKLAADFDRAVQESVNLDAKNTSNFKKRDLAVIQIVDLAKTHGVELEIK